MVIHTYPQLIWCYESWKINLGIKDDLEWEGIEVSSHDLDVIIDAINLILLRDFQTHFKDEDENFLTPPIFFYILPV